MIRAALAVAFLWTWAATCFAQSEADKMAKQYPPPPKVDPREFDGIYEMDLPELIGQATPLVKNSLACSGGKCVYFVGGEKQATWDKVGAIAPFAFAGAQYSLKYAMDRKAEAKKEAPYLAPLLDSGAKIVACIELGTSKRDEPGLIILCKIDRAPWKTPGVLLMGLVLSDRCTAFCGYSIIPLLRR